MVRLLTEPVRIPAAGEPPKVIEELVGRLSTGTEAFSVARMESPPGWSEPGQRPEFDECTVVVSGSIHMEHEGGTVVVRAGQAVIVEAGEWVRYSTTEPAEYFAICVPAFSMEAAHRDE